MSLLDMGPPPLTHTELFLKNDVLLKILISCQSCIFKIILYYNQGAVQGNPGGLTDNTRYLAVSFKSLQNAIVM